MDKADKHLYEFAPFLLDEANRLLIKDGKTVHLTPKAFETLLVLVKNHGQVIEKDRLLNEVWTDSFVEEGSLSRNIHELRKALGDDSGKPDYIETLPRRGYRFVAVVNKRQTGDTTTAIQPAEDTASTTLIEKHTYARIITEEETAPAVPVIEVEPVRELSHKATSPPSFWQSKRIVLVIALGLIVVISLFVYLKYFRRAPEPPAISSAPDNQLRLTNNP